MRRLLYRALICVALFLLTGCFGNPEAVVTPTGSDQALTEATPTGLPATTSNTEPETSPTEKTVEYCLECHSDQTRLQAAAGESSKPTSGLYAAWIVASTPLDPLQKVWVDGDVFPQSIHGLKGCVSCHGGQQLPEKETAHIGLVSNPSGVPEPICGDCHPNIVASAHTNLHNSLAGFQRSLEARSLPSTYPPLETMFDNNCAGCHTTCGECHVSQPKLAGGGLIAGHAFQAIAPMTQTCTICHGTRVGAEYLGENKNLAADVHYSSGEMNCENCHTSQQAHGQPAECQSCHPGPQAAQRTPPDHRYQGVQAPRCESCHTAVTTGEDEIIMHQMHGATLSCQVCHAVAYTNCKGCHTTTDPETGQASYRLDRQYTAFLIGRNPIQTYERPYRYVTVRQVPVVPDSFANYGKDLLPDYTQLETWKYTTPHNIQRRTPQAESCNSCHGNPAWFLTPDKIGSQAELLANRDVVVETPPPQISSADQLP